MVVMLDPQEGVEETTAESLPGIAAYRATADAEAVASTVVESVDGCEVGRETYLSEYGRWQETEYEGCVSAWERWQETQLEGCVPACERWQRLSPRVSCRSGAGGLRSFSALILFLACVWKCR